MTILITLMLSALVIILIAIGGVRSQKKNQEPRNAASFNRKDFDHLIK